MLSTTQIIQTVTLAWLVRVVQGEVMRIVGVEPPQPGCQPTMLELKTSTMQIVRLPLAYTGNFEEVVDHNRLYTLGKLTTSARIEPAITDCRA